MASHHQHIKACMHHRGDQSAQNTKAVNQLESPVPSNIRYDTRYRGTTLKTQYEEDTTFLYDREIAQSNVASDTR
eukprot:scaffold227328_cov43-Prasinocladus_malaysianus.AAC.1